MITKQEDKGIQLLVATVLAASRKHLIRSKKIYVPHAPVSPQDLLAVEHRIGVSLPNDLRQWLLTLGYGDIADEISFREEWFAAIETGELRGGVIFAQDIRGNFFAFDPAFGRVYYLSRAEAVFSRVSDDFLSFIEELVRRDYQIGDWMDEISTQPYSW